MRATGMLLVCAACGGGAQSMSGGGGGGLSAGSERADITAVKSDLSVYTDGKGHYVAFVEPDWEKPSPPDLTLFYGDGKTFHASQVGNASEDGMRFEIGFMDPRIPASPAGSVKREGGKVTLSCWGTDAELTKLPAAEAQTMVGGASYFKNATQYSPLALARKGDSYLYVDSEVGEGENYRVFSGKKGSMKSLPVKNAQYDRRTNTFTFVTDKGTLVAERDPDAKESAFSLGWDGKKEGWETMERSESWKLIFNELGIYKTRTPTPCDLALQ